MELNTFILKIAEQFENTTASTFSATTRFKDVEGWSSLTALMIISMIDEEYEVVIKGDDIRNSLIINDLYEVVKSKKQHV